MKNEPRPPQVPVEPGAGTLESTATAGTPRESGTSAARLRGFGPIGVVAFLVIFLAGNRFVAGYLIPAGALLVLAWAKASRTPWREIGYAQPRNWFYTILVGIGLGVILKLAMKAVVMPLLGAPPVNSAFQHLAANPALIAATVWTMLVVGFAEETFWRGFLFERLRKLMGKVAGERRWTTATILAVSSILFGLAHLVDQGLPGAQQALVTGLVFGAAYLATGNLWLPMVAHSAFDLTAYALIYWGLETKAATFLFSA